MKRTGLYSALYLLVAVCVSVSSLPGQESATELEERIDKVFAEYDRLDSPGCALGVIVAGELNYARGYGMASLEHGIPVTPDTVFRTGSVGKQFTAMAIALAAEQGKLALNDDIRKTLPELPYFGSTVTIRHLIHHTSGLRDYLQLMALAGKGDEDYYTDQDVLDMLARQEALNFEPGTEFLYSNSGYFLLSQIILRATGQTLREFAAENIFEPLAMDNSHYHDDHTEIVPKRASGYAPDGDGGFKISMTTLPMIGDGGVFTSIKDMLEWDNNFYANSLGKGDASLIELVETPGALNSNDNNDGGTLDYAFGLRVSQYRDLRTVGHGGSFVGFQAATLRFPEQHFSVICLCNVSSARPSQLVRRVFDVYHEDEIGPSEDHGNRPEQRAGDAEKENESMTGDLAEFAGDYYSRELQVTYKLRVKDGNLVMAQRNAPADPLRIVKPDTFRTGPLELAFVRDANGAVQGFAAGMGRVRNIKFVRM